MSKVGQIERATQNRLVKLFQEVLKYRYLGNWENEEENSNVDEALLTAFLTKQGHSLSLINKVLFEFKKTVTINTSDDLSWGMVIPRKKAIPIHWRPNW